MIITRTPLRVSLFGGSTDLSQYFKKHGSLIIGFAINKYVYTTMRYTPVILPHRTCLYYSETERVDDNSLIKNPAVRGTLEYLQSNDPLEISHMIDLPSKTGLGSSSSFIVGLLNAFHQLKHDKPETKTNLSKQAIAIEREEVLKETGGWQDQIWAAFGGVNSIRIDKEGKYRVRPLSVCQEFLQEFNQSMVLFYTGDQRQSFDVSKSHDNKDAEPHKIQIQQLAEEALKAFEAENIEDIGKLLDQSWQHKKRTSNLISNPHIDDLYTTAKRHGAIGAKLLGAGKAGFLLCITNDRHRLIRNLDRQHIEFSFDFEGSKIILS